MSDPIGTRERTVVIIILAVVAAGAMVDVILDAPATLLSLHVLLELAIAASSVGMIVYLTARWRRSERSLATARERIEHVRRESEEWRQRAHAAVAGFAAAIDRQLQTWQLTPAERDVAFGLLKGLSHKRIAALTGRSERTVRQHAIAVYQKAGVAGRAELAAFFLDALLPGANEEGSTPGPAAPAAPAVTAPPRPLRSVTGQG